MKISFGVLAFNAFSNYFTLHNEISIESWNKNDAINLYDFHKNEH